MDPFTSQQALLGSAEAQAQESASRDPVSNAFQGAMAPHHRSRDYKSPFIRIQG